MSKYYYNISSHKFPQYIHMYKSIILNNLLYCIIKYLYEFSCIGILKAIQKIRVQSLWKLFCCWCFSWSGSWSQNTTPTSYENNLIFICNEYGIQKTFVIEKYSILVFTKLKNVTRFNGFSNKVSREKSQSTVFYEIKCEKTLEVLIGFKKHVEAVEL